MKKLFSLYFSILILLSTQIFAETVTISADRYRLRAYNWVEDPGLKINAADETTTLPCGMYARYTGYDSEILCDFNLSSIPEDAIITSVNFEYMIENVVGPFHYTIVKAYKNTRDWQKIPLPEYSSLGTSPWLPEDIIVEENNTFTGLRTFPQNENFKNLVQEWVNNPASNKGLILTNNAGFYGYRIEVSSVKIIVEYNQTTPGMNDFKVTPLLSYFAAYAKDNVVVTNESEVAGRIGTGESGDATVSVSSSVTGDIYSGDNCYIVSGSSVNGDLTALNSITVENSASVTGNIKDQTPTLEFNPDYSNDATFFGPIVIAIEDQTQRIFPGDYSLIKGHNRSTIILEAGTYNLAEFNITGDDCKLIFDIEPDEEINIFIRDYLSFGSRLITEFTNAPNPISVKFYTQQTYDLVLQNNSIFYGIFRAPNSNVKISNHCILYGSLYAKGITINDHSTICKPPILTDFTHSEWAYAPPFDPDITQYTAIVPQSTGSLTITPTSEYADYTLQVNGMSPETQVAIASGTTEKVIEIKVSGGVAGLSTVYTLTAKKDPDDNYAIRVKAGATGTPMDGKTWETAFRKIPPTMGGISVGIGNATIQGKEIWVANGEYENEADGFTSVIDVFPGIEIIGGFKGTETERKPEGSIYGTILSGDGDKNDDQVTSWPPSEQDINMYLMDNARHVIQLVFCGKGAISTKIEGITITNGFANRVTGGNSRGIVTKNYPSLSSMIETGIYYKSYNKPLFDYNIGGGVYISHGAPTISKCVIKNNYSYENGAGIFGRGGPANLKNCLFEENSTITSDGAGLYITNAKNTFIDGCIFDGNYTMAELPGDQMLGGAIYALCSKIDIVNTIFTGNYATTAGGAIYNEKSFLKLINCTVTGNDAGYPGGGIVNKVTEPDFYSTKIVNTILWNNHESHTSELVGENFDVSYSCVDGGYAGVGNISGDPEFETQSNPKGEDGFYGGYDDGLQLSKNSPCIGAGMTIPIVFEDIITIPRPFNSNYDIGAYEFSREGSLIGAIEGGVFVSKNVYIIPNAETDLDIKYASKNPYFTRVIKVVQPNIKFLRNKSVVFGKLRRKGSNTGVTIKLYNFGMINGKLVFQTQTFIGTGKPVIFVNNISLENEYEDAYVIYCLPHDEFEISFSHNQFSD